MEIFLENIDNKDLFHLENWYTLPTKIQHCQDEDIIFNLKNLTHSNAMFIVTFSALLMISGIHGHIVTVKDINPSVKKELEYYQFKKRFAIRDLSDNALDTNHLNMSLEFDQKVDTYYHHHMNVFTNDLQIDSAFFDILDYVYKDLFLNVYTHSASIVGSVCYTSVNTEKKYMEILMMDLGEGIVNHIRQSQKQKKSSDYFLKLAFERKFSTQKSERMNSGMGLFILRKFIEFNQGYMEIYSNDVGMIFDGKKSFIVPVEADFPGTFFKIRIYQTEAEYSQINKFFVD